MTYADISFVFDDSNSYSVENQITVVDLNCHSFKINTLSRVESTIAIICRKGELKCKVNALEYTVKAPCLLIVILNHFVEINSVSNDFEGVSVLMVDEFTESLGIEDRLRPFMAITKNSCVPLKKNELNSLEEFCTMIKRLSHSNENPFILESSKYLTKAYYYGFGSGLFFYSKVEKGKKSSNEMLINHFLEMVQQNYHHQRKLKYYSESLHLTPKYLSKVVKERTGFSASKWISKFVLMEAKMLLKSTDLTVQQVSDKLNFSTQSFFGKYFKKHTGISPSIYRAKKVN